MADLIPPPLRDDCFALPPGIDWTPVEVAQARLRDRLHRVTTAQTRPLGAALGAILAQDVVARRSNPPLPNSAVDGYGFAFDSLPTGDPVLPLSEGRAAAGLVFDGEVAAGQAIRVLTGAALPKGVDTVVLEEDVTRGDGKIAFRQGVRKGANTRQAGEDVTEGQAILKAGHRIGVADLALCAAVGVADLDVFSRLRVAVISTGDELIEAGEVARPGQIHDANRPMLLGLLAKAGYEAVDLGRIGDDRDRLRAGLDAGAMRADVILTSGGASAGDEDHVSALLNESGAMGLWRIAIKPGRPLALGMWNGVPVFGLPGNPVAALVCALVFGLPAMGLLAGQGWRDPLAFPLPAGFSKRKKAGRREYLRARVRDGKVEVFASEGSGRISGLSWAEGLVELPDHAMEVHMGDPVRFLPWGSFGV
ncbi:MAG: molybdopterin molybdenumtransferase MoeA [Rhodobacterales bacterium]|nr:MAG: molybdopterin molybdenumtransferase MoeA [Rhodobacterales bacterium]